MKRTMSLLLLAGWAAGCDTLPKLWDQPKAEPVRVAATPLPSRPAVTADQVSDANARAMADALRDEIGRDAQGNTLPPRAK